MTNFYLLYLLRKFVRKNFYLLRGAIPLTVTSYKQHEWLTDLTQGKDNTLTCSFEVTAQNTISVKFCEGNMRKQIPPIGLLSLTKARVLCFLEKKTT